MLAGSVVVSPVASIVKAGVFSIAARVAPDEEPTLGNNEGLLVFGEGDGSFSQGRHGLYCLVELDAGVAVAGALGAVDGLAQFGLVLGEKVLSHGTCLSVFTALALLLIQAYILLN